MPPRAYPAALPAIPAVRGAPVPSSEVAIASTPATATTIRNAITSRRLRVVRWLANGDGPVGMGRRCFARCRRLSRACAIGSTIAPDGAAVESAWAGLASTAVSLDIRPAERVDDELVVRLRRTDPTALVVVAAARRGPARGDRRLARLGALRRTGRRPDRRQPDARVLPHPDRARRPGSKTWSSAPLPGVTVSARRSIGRRSPRRPIVARRTSSLTSRPVA